ncbi:MAG: hypothetical protein CVU55_05805 [Deltaproteobacteria bacterium HGW-Deltaproteobacteria-13]|jgi:LysM repeat protein|nr:MAG: hypothetical protein CVU55_05805 [Deltaproteobacteria bacterium HGW-Deltaproteobacteria-13]
MKEARIIRYTLIAFLLLTSITFAEQKETKTHKVIKGDTLWDISKAELNDPFLWSKVWEENRWIANPDLIYPGQRITIPLTLLPREKNEEVVTPKPAAPSPEPALAAEQPYKTIAEDATAKTAPSSLQPVIVMEQPYKGIKGIILQNGEAIEGQIISMSAETVRIRTKDGTVSSYSFIKELDSFIHEHE